MQLPAVIISASAPRIRFASPESSCVPISPMCTSFSPSASRMCTRLCPRVMPRMLSCHTSKELIAKGQSLSGLPESTTPSR